MKDQHTKISGYRDLTQQEIDLMNEIKQLEAHVLQAWEAVNLSLVASSTDRANDLRICNAQAFRWLDMARNDLEKGFMCLVRAVAQPQPTKVKE